MDATYPLGNVMPCHGEGFAASVVRTVAEQWPTREEYRTREAQLLARAGLPDPSFVEVKERKRQSAASDPTEREIYGYVNASGQRVPGLTHEVRTQGFMRLLKDSDEELSRMTAEERAELAAMQSPAIGPQAPDAHRAGLARESVPEFFPAWNSETFVLRRMHNPGDFRQHAAHEEPYTVAEHTYGDIMAGLN